MPSSEYLHDPFKGDPHTQLYILTLLEEHFGTQVNPQLIDLRGVKKDFAHRHPNRYTEEIPDLIAHHDSSFLSDFATNSAHLELSCERDEYSFRQFSDSSTAAMVVTHSATPSTSMVLEVMALPLHLVLTGSTTTLQGGLNF